MATAATTLPQNVPASQSGKTTTSPRTIPTMVPKEAQARLVSYLAELRDTQSMRSEMHENLTRIDREYARQGNYGKEHKDNKAANESGDKRKIQDMTVPIIYPQVEAGLAYLTGTFLSGYPIFGLVTDPEKAPIADALESVLADQQQKMGWIRHLTMAMRDGLKYNIQAVEVNWVTQTSFSLVNDDLAGEGRAKKGSQINWEGNRIKRLDPYNLIFDYRVHPANIHTHGEFAGYVEIMSRIMLKQFVADLPEAINLKEAFESGPVGGTTINTTTAGSPDSYFIPEITDKLNPDPSSGEFDWLKWAYSEKATFQYRNAYEVTTLYCRILPADFGIRVPAENTVQIWKLIFVNSQVLIYAERMTNVHNYLPIVFGQPTEDGLGYQTLSFAENLLSPQEMASALWNIRIASERRNVSDRALYDVTRIRPEDINSSNPAAKIPVRPTGYSRPIQDAFYQIPFNMSASASAVQDAMQMMDFARSISGISKPQQGEFIKGNRTLKEFQDIMNNSDARLQLMAIFLEAQWYTPIKEIIKTNILQYQVVSKVFSSKAKGYIEVNPIQFRELAFQFKVSDGLLPTAKIVNSDFLKQFLTLLSTNQELAAKFDIAKLVAYLASIENIPAIENFIRTQEVNPNAGAPTPTSASTQRGAEPRAS